MANIRVARRSGRVLRGGSLRRDTRWLQLAETTTTLAAGTPVVFTGFDADVLAMRPFTIVRSRGVLHLATDQLSASEVAVAVMGWAVVSDQALAVGVTAVPTPITEGDSDLWFLYESLITRVDFGSAIGFDSSSGNLKEFDSRAMRKVEDGQDIAVVMEASAASGFSGCRMSKQGRMLIKLH